MNEIKAPPNAICGICNTRFYPETDTVAVGKLRWGKMMTEIHVHRKACLHRWRFINERR